MPELPDVAIYVERLNALVGGQPLREVRLGSPFFLRTVTPPLASFAGSVLERVTRLGKRLVFEFPNDKFLVVHLMIAGRFKLVDVGKPIPQRVGLAVFEFPTVGVLVTEQGTKKRASLMAFASRAELSTCDRGGLEVLEHDLSAFVAAMTRENRTLKRALTDPTILSGIGNAYSDEILHRAGLSPFRQTRQLNDDEWATLWSATRATLNEWLERLRAEVGAGFPGKVTAFRPEMAVHGRYGQPCPRCGSPIQRIRYAENEANYCAQCQTGGRLLADRSLSQLLKADWPKTLDELEAKKQAWRGDS